MWVYLNILCLFCINLHYSWNYAEFDKKACFIRCIVHGVGVSSVDEVLRKDLQQIWDRAGRLPGRGDEGEDSKCLVRCSSYWILCSHREQSIVISVSICGMTFSHPPGGRLPLLFARPAVTSVIFTRWRQMYTAADIRFQLTTHLLTQKAWKAWVGWHVAFTHSCRSTSYHCATQPTIQQYFTKFLQPATRGCIGFALCVFVVSVRVPKTDNFITTSHFPFTWGVWTHSGMSICLGLGVGLGLFVHLMDFVQLLYSHICAEKGR